MQPAASCLTCTSPSDALVYWLQLAYISATATSTYIQSAAAVLSCKMALHRGYRRLQIMHSSSKLMAPSRGSVSMSYETKFV